LQQSQIFCNGTQNLSVQHAYFNRHGNRQSEAFENYVSGFVEFFQSQVKGCSACHNHTMHAVKVSRAKKGVSAVWKCTTCGRIAYKEITSKELVEEFNTALKH